MKNLKKYIASWLLAVALLVSTGCGYMAYGSYDAAVIGGADGPTSIIIAESSEAGVESSSEVVVESGEAGAAPSSEAVIESSEAVGTEPSGEISSEASSESSTEVVATENEEEAGGEDVSLDPDGSYTTCEDVALYLETYGELPDNFITKKEARELGWEGGSLEPYAPGKCIGGDKFGNYEGLLPKDGGRTYKECDIDTLGAKSRGAKRIVYSNDGLIYYTEDHYESFTLLYE